METFDHQAIENSISIFLGSELYKCGLSEAKDVCMCVVWLSAQWWVVLDDQSESFPSLCEDQPSKSAGATSVSQGCLAHISEQSLSIGS